MADRFDVSRWPGRDQTIVVDGRRIGLRRYGIEGGLPLVMLHGTPGSRIMFAGTDAIARDHGIEIIAPDRWCYGLTEAPGVASLERFADDIAAVMTSLGHARFAVAGVSGGGPYTAAIATRHPARVTAAAMISPVGLVTEALRNGEVDAFHRFCFRLLPRAPLAVETIFRLHAAAVRASPRLACGLATARAPRSDKSIMSDCATSERLLAAFGEGLARSKRGPAIDLALFRDIDALDLSRATMPTHVWIGTEDRNVPVAAAKRLAARLPAAELTVLDGAGHLWVAHNYDAILGWVRDAAMRGTTFHPASSSAHG